MGTPAVDARAAAAPAVGRRCTAEVSWCWAVVNSGDIRDCTCAADEAAMIRDAQSSGATARLVIAARAAVASRKPCPDQACIGLRCTCWHCQLRRSLQAYETS